ncbi:(Lyso)-N-acylphosphatidylethanolamine lipase isoform 2-T2 [Sarcophilus harrisii]
MSQLKNVEARILQCLQNKFLARYVSLPNHNKIWTVTVSPELEDRTPLVMVHGFGGGVGLWILNMDSLSTRRTVHTFDLLGFGRSSRPIFPRDAQGAEDEFVTSIETWRETMGIPNMILLGHSLGGFLATSYSIKYPERVKHLILVDPWGFPLRPTDPSEIRAPPTWVKALVSVLGRSNPLAVLRVAGPWGPGLIQRFRPDFKRKFADFFDDDTISEYIYHCNAQNPSGETAFKAMMESFGWARRPMLERIHLIRKDVPITMIYGANTWIDTSTGEKVKLRRPGSYVRDVQKKDSLTSQENLDPTMETLFTDTSPSRNESRAWQSQPAMGIMIPIPPYSKLWEAGDGGEKEENHRYHQIKNTLVSLMLTESELLPE